MNVEDYKKLEAYYAVAKSLKHQIEQIENVPASEEAILPSDWRFQALEQHEVIWGGCEKWKRSGRETPA